MMFTRNPYEAYRQQDVDTSNKEELVGKLYNEASLCLRRAVTAIDQKRLDKANSCIIKAQIIIKSLNECLDLQYDIGRQLRSLYQYMMKRMYEANMKKDKDILEEIAGMLADLRNTWGEAVKRYKIARSS